MLSILVPVHYIIYNVHGGGNKRKTHKGQRDAEHGFCGIKQLPAEHKRSRYQYIFDVVFNSKKLEVGF